jgi:hypothetical protein
VGEEEERIGEWRVVRCVDKSKRDFIAQNTRDEAEVLSSRADRFAGAKRGEKSRLAPFEMTVVVLGDRG